LSAIGPIHDNYSALDGRLPDVVVDGVGIEDWQSFLDLVREQGWPREMARADEETPWPRAVDLFPGGRPLDEPPTLTVRPFEGVQVNVYPYAIDEIAFDVDLRELQGQVGIDRLCGLMRLVGRTLSRDVPLPRKVNRAAPSCATTSRRTRSGPSSPQ
jgi:hypothetical protein